MIHMLGSTFSFKRQDSSFPTDQVVTCSHITIIRRAADELWRSNTGRDIAVLVGTAISWSRVDL